MFRLSGAYATLSWCLAALASAALDGRVDLGSQALPLVLAAALSALWLPAWAAGGACVVAALAFNWCFVPPRGTLQINAPGHVLLLLAMLGVSLAVAALVSRQRRLTEQASINAMRVRELLQLGERLRLTNGKTHGHSRSLQQALLQALQEAVAPMGWGPVFLLMDGIELDGPVSADEAAGLALSQSQGQAFGPGTGRYEHQGCWYLPLRGSRSVVGAALLRPGGHAVVDEAGRLHAQALCDQIGLAVEQANTVAAAADDAQQAHDQRVRNTLLVAISHDYRTPLAAILGAASALRDQFDRQSPSQRLRLIDSIVDEVTQLGRLTDNALQLARLGTRGVELSVDWQSAEELVGSVLARVRQRDPQRRVRVRVEPGAPLVRCDATLIVQLLENLVDNALKYTPLDSPVEVLVRVEHGEHASRLLIAVRDRGPGVPPAWRQRIFDVFQRMASPDSSSGTLLPSDAARPRGAGVGLAVCRAIAEAHGGSLSIRARGHGGAAFECRLPLVAMPETPTNGDINP